MRKYFTPTPRLLVAMKLVILVAPIVLLAWLANQRFMFTPTITVTYRAGTKPGAVQPETGNIIRTYNSNWLLKDSLDFKVRIPRLVESVRIRASLVNRNQPIIRLVATGSDEAGDQSRLIRHQVLDSLDWNRIDNQALHLWQRPDRDVIETSAGPNGETVERVVGQTPVRQSGTVEEFLGDLPPAQAFATVELDPFAFSFVPNYQPALAPITIPHAFRGTHTLYVYAANEDLRLRFEKIDLNRETGPDPLTILVRSVSLDPNNRTLLMRKTIQDDGRETDDNQHGRPQPVDVVLPDLPPGMYRIELQASDDVLVRNLLSDQHYLVFAGRVFFADGPTYAGSSPDFRRFQIRTSQSALKFKTKHPEGQQAIVSGQQRIELTGVGPAVELRDLQPDVPVELERADVIVDGPGMIAVGPARLPESPPAAFGDGGSLDAYDYILSSYFPKRTTGRVVVDETFELRRLLLTTNDLHFQLELPGLRAADRRLELRTISATLRRGAFPWGKIPEKIRSLFNGS